MNRDEPVPFSLIVPTLNRRDEVERLLMSLDAQTCRDFEVILVDQNADDLLGDLCRKFAARLPLQHIRKESRARHPRAITGLGSPAGPS